jgi:molybdopterin synthase catalytic subunit
VFGCDVLGSFGVVVGWRAEEWRNAGRACRLAVACRRADRCRREPAQGEKQECGSVRVVVRLFAILRERAGTGEILMDLPDGATVASAAEHLKDAFPSVRDHAKHVAYAVNREYVSTETELRDGDELAVIPPVSGG